MDRIFICAIDFVKLETYSKELLKIFLKKHLIFLTKQHFIIFLFCDENVKNITQLTSKFSNHKSKINCV